MPITNDEWEKINSALRLMRQPSVQIANQPSVFRADVIELLSQYREKGEEEGEK